MKALLLCILLAGCASAPPVVEHVSAPPPKVQLPDEPVYAVQTLKKGDRYDAVLRAYVASLVQARGYAAQLRELLDQK